MGDNLSAPGTETSKKSRQRFPLPMNLPGVRPSSGALRFMALMRVQSWRSKLPMNLRPLQRGSVTRSDQGLATAKSPSLSTSQRQVTPGFNYGIWIKVAVLGAARGGFSSATLPMPVNPPVSVAPGLHPSWLGKSPFLLNYQIARDVLANPTFPRGDLPYHLHLINPKCRGVTISGSLISA